MPIGQGFASTLAAAKEGAEWAWSALYHDLVGPLTGYLASRGAPDPDDAAAEVFYEVARSLRRFEGDEAAFRSWVFVIAHRRLIDLRRRRSRRPETTTWTTAASRAGGDAEQEAIDALVTGEIQSALALLTDDQREVLSLRIVAGLTLEETARVVGKRVGAVKALQRRAVGALRKIIVLGAVTL